MDKNDENLDFLNYREQPTEELIFKAFGIQMTDAKTFNAHIPLEVIKNLEEPTNMEIVDGKYWSLSKLTWETPNGLYTRIEIVKLDIDVDDIEDIDFEDVSDENVNPFDINYDGELSKALEIEDYEEAVRLREWLRDSKSVIYKLKPLMAKALEDEDFSKLNEYLTTLKDFYKTL